MVVVKADVVLLLPKGGPGRIENRRKKEEKGKHKGRGRETLKA